MRVQRFGTSWSYKLEMYLGMTVLLMLMGVLELAYLLEVTAHAEYSHYFGAAVSCYCLSV